MRAPFNALRLDTLTRVFAVLRPVLRRFIALRPAAIVRIKYARKKGLARDLPPARQSA
jgi:hypothetical protein